MLGKSGRIGGREQMGWLVQNARVLFMNEHCFTVVKTIIIVL